MDLNQVLETLEAAGSAQTRKTYARHGVRGAQFGVSYAVFKKMAGQIKTDQALAEQLWGSNNHDARVLATMIADHGTISRKTLTAWSKSLDSPPLTDAFSGVVARSPHAIYFFDQWRDHKNEYLATAAWNIVTRLAIEPELAAALGLEDDFFARLLAVIEQEIHGRSNRVRYTMNGTLIAIALRGSELKKLALAAARRIGKVEVDHGDTSCQTPDAVTYIEKAAARRPKKSARPATKKSQPRDSAPVASKPRAKHAR